MDHFSSRHDGLYAEDVPLRRIADAVGTPLYIYSAATLRRHYDILADEFKNRDALIAFAVKALSNIAVLALLGRRGAGADIVSGGELYRALKAGIPAERVVFSGVAKSRGEMEAALNAGILQFNVESEAELAHLSAVASALGKTAPVALRVNPDVDAGTDTRISTGRKDDKFGVPFADAGRLYRLAAALPGLRPQGLTVHIGSQITSVAPFERAAARVGGLVTSLRAEGHEVTHLDLGGGLGIPYERAAAAPPLPVDYAATLNRATADLNVRLILEPGRLIAGNAGLFVTRIVLTKNQEGTHYALVDGAMNDLIRPALYGARHEVMEDTPPTGVPVHHHIAGPVCESTDLFAKDVPLHEVSAGALLAFRTAGAYGAVQASQYNTRPLVPEVLVDGDRFTVIRRRPTYEEMLSLEVIPDDF
ncbi:Orn/DAP/Arg decarboxylase, family 2 [Parvularcula bermudensis HTCC2503]|uniref:Diaminopimelate decarboxylase n=1 Tax=Parvularcula bermudensis (strain ATCC BAA-594 / HTCC2503 / KCTC 12087) TaxID=314260 RepID=E0TFT1_PARBH|nr:Orn/DAP/Arg decarboxylase, family 2 [Parvularcula bermudensis HTCC2503]